MLATYTVIETGDAPYLPGVTVQPDPFQPDTFTATSLRAAIEASNQGLGGDTINFSIGDAIQRIFPQTPLPAVAKSIVIDGRAPTDKPNQRIVIDGSQGNGLGDGLVIASAGAAQGSTVRGLYINNFTRGFGISLLGDGRNTLQGNWIGLGLQIDAGGKVVLDRGLGNFKGGVRVVSDENTIGGDLANASQANVIANNVGSGIVLENSDGNIIKGNYIGNVPGNVIAAGNGGNGILLKGRSNLVGGFVAEDRNIISGNTGNGVQIHDDPLPFVRVSSSNRLYGGVKKGRSSFYDANQAPCVAWVLIATDCGRKCYV